MDPEPAPHRETLLALVLTVLAGGGFLVFLIAITGGFFLYALLITAGLIGFGALNYLLWGRSMLRQAEREREADAPRPEEDEWTRRF